MRRTVAYALAALTLVGVLMALTVRAPAGVRQDPFLAFNFRVEIDGIVSSSFSEASGLSCTTEVVEYRDGNDPNTIRLLPGATRCGPIDLKRGVTGNLDLWNWAKAIENGQVDRRSGSIVLTDAKGNDAARWTFVNAWPAKIAGPTLDAKSNEVAIEEIVLVTEGITRVM